MGLYDRDYMKTPPPDKEPRPPFNPWVVVVAVIILIAFILGSIL